MQDTIEIVTADTITDEQIKTLRGGAAEAGDDMLVAYCALALGYTPMIALNTTPYGARGACACSWMLRTDEHEQVQS